MRSRAGYRREKRRGGSPQRTPLRETDLGGYHKEYSRLKQTIGPDLPVLPVGGIEMHDTEYVRDEDRQDY